MSIIITDAQNSNYEDKRIIYELYYFIIEQIKGKKININEKEFEENISSTNISTIVHYIKESIPILINKKIGEYIKNKKIIDNNSKDNKSMNQSYIYENQIINLEKQLRFYISKQLQSKIQKESYDNKIRNFIEMENEFESLKQKVKYNGKHFLDNDRKENEIEILRRENSNLKKAISKIEQEKKLTDSKTEISQKTILNLRNQIEKLNNKLYKVEQELTEIKENANSKINININNGKTSSNLIINQNFELPKRNKYLKNQKASLTYNEVKKTNPNNIRRSTNNIFEDKLFTNSYNKILNSISNSISNRNTISSKKNKKNHRNNSMNNIEEIKKAEIISKYFTNRGHKNHKSNFNNYFKFSQLTSGIPSSKISIIKDQKISKNSSLSLMNVNNTKISKSGNRSTINIKSTSNDNS